MDELAMLLQDPNLPPELLQQLLGLGTLDERGGLLQQQMGMADVLRQRGPQRSSPLGAALGGLSDAIGGIAAGQQQKALMGKMEGLLGQKDKGRLAMAELLRRRGQQPQATPDFDMPVPMY